MIYIQKGIKLTKQSEITWNLSRKQWNVMKRDKKFIFASNDNDCWQIGLEADYIGHAKKNKNKNRNNRNMLWLSDPYEYWLKLRLNKWPQEIYKLVVKYRVLLYYKSDGKKGKPSWNGVWNKWKGCMDDKDNIMYDWEYLKLGIPERMGSGHNFEYPNKIKVEFVVDKVFDVSNDEIIPIPSDSWSEYGIVDGDK